MCKELLVYPKKFYFYIRYSMSFLITPRILWFFSLIFYIGCIILCLLLHFTECKQYLLLSFVGCRGPRCTMCVFVGYSSIERGFHWLIDWLIDWCLPIICMIAVLCHINSITQLINEVEMGLKYTCVCVCIYRTILSGAGNLASYSSLLYVSIYT